MIKQEKIEAIAKRIADEFNPEKIILFGSYASGNPGKDSDLDFIIVKNSNQPRHKRGREIRRFLIGTKVPIDLKVYTPDEFLVEQKVNYSFLKSALKGAKVLYEREN